MKLEASGVGFKLSIPEFDGLNNRVIEIKPGELMYVVGANGSGKSGLLHLFHRAHSESEMLTAQRNSYFQTDTVNYQPNQVTDYEQRSRSFVHDKSFRWTNIPHADHAGVLASKLIQADNSRNRRIVDPSHSADRIAELIASEVSVFERINTVFRLAGLAVRVRVETNDAIAAERGDLNAKYSVAHMSDGERAAFIVAAHILTAKHNTLILLDEPERHFHSSISVPLLAALLSMRSDCAIVIATHELSLVRAIRPSKTIIVSRCDYRRIQPSTTIPTSMPYSPSPTVGPVRWDFEVLEGDTQIPEAVIEAIIGGRTNVIFVEGKKDSLDYSLYSRLFPTAQVIARDTCGDVIRAVQGVNATQSVNWLNAKGIVDGDYRPNDVRTELLARSVFAIQTNAVESILLHHRVRDAVISVMVRLNGTQIDIQRQAVVDAINAWLGEGIDSNLQRHIRKEYFGKYFADNRHLLANKATDATDESISIQLPTEIDHVLGEITSSSDGEEWIRQLPIKKTKLPKLIASALGISSPALYYQIAIEQIVNDDSLRQFVVDELIGLD